MRILAYLYCGSLIPREMTAKSSPLCAKLRSPVLLNDERMNSMLTSEQREQFEQCQQANDELSALQEREAFSTGFCLAVKIMTEVMTIVEMPSIDE